MKKDISIEEFDAQYGKMPIILLGAGNHAKSIIKKYGWNIRYLVDSDVRKVDTNIEGNKVKSWDYLIRNITKEDILLITCDVCEEIERIINDKSELKENLVFAFPYMLAISYDMGRVLASNVSFELTKGKENKIPKKLHYFWFSGDPFPDEIKRCIDSWYKVCPNYEIIQWNLDNYKTNNIYFNQAIECGKWAFASDFSRCDVVYKYGGIYLDSDVELYKPLDDLLYDECFFNFESKDYIEPGAGFGAIVNHPIIGSIRNKYEEYRFVTEDGKKGFPSILEVYTGVLLDAGVPRDGCFYRGRDVTVYPPVVMCGHSYRTGYDIESSSSYGIHHCKASWVDEAQKRASNNRLSYFQSNIELKNKIYMWR